MKKFRLFSNCIPVEGIVRSTICDIQRGKYFFIPNDLHFLLKGFRNQPMSEIYKEYGIENKETIDEYYDFLISEDLGFYMDESDDDTEFPAFNLAWEVPASITNSIIEISIKSSSKAWLFNGLNQLEKMGCKCVELRFIDAIQEDELLEVLSSIQDSRLTDIKLVFAEKSDISFEKVLQQNIRVSCVTIFNAGISDIQTVYSIPIILINEKFDPHLTCGNVNENTFMSNKYLFTESYNYNNCLNKKVSIGQNGDIKNCPSSTQSFGNIMDVDLSSVLSNSSFTDVWNINKDHIDVCKSCEFRYVCTDCRVFVENPEDAFSKPLKCGYDPSTGEWSDWSKNPLKQNAINYFGLNTLPTSV